MPQPPRGGRGFWQRAPKGPRAAQKALPHPLCRAPAHPAQPLPADGPPRHEDRQDCVQDR